MIQILPLLRIPGGPGQIHKLFLIFLIRKGEKQIDLVTRKIVQAWPVTSNGGTVSPDENGIEYGRSMERGRSLMKRV